MTVARITKTAAQVLQESTAAARVTKTAAQVLQESTAAARVTKLSVHVLVDVTPPDALDQWVGVISA